MPLARTIPMGNTDMKLLRKHYASCFRCVNMRSKKEMNACPGFVIIVICQSVDIKSDRPAVYSLAPAPLKTKDKTTSTKKTDKIVKEPLRSLLRFASVRQGLLGGVTGAFSAIMT